MPERFAVIDADRLLSSIQERWGRPRGDVVRATSHSPGQQSAFIGCCSVSHSFVTLARRESDGGGAMTDNQTKELVVPIYYDDGKVIHVCESGIIHPDIHTVWAKCNRDVPPGQGFTLRNVTIEVTCPKCLAAGNPA
jgi:hypothetical protein